MGYLQEFESELAARLADLGESEQKEVIRFVKEKVLESYKNGLKAPKRTGAGNKAGQESSRVVRGK